MNRYSALIISIILVCAHESMAFKLGLENISPELLVQLKGRSIGLITNQSGRDQKGRPTVEVLANYGIKIHTIFVPEHGLHGVVPAGVEINNTTDSSGTPVVSLYGNGAGKKLSPETFTGVDTVLFDIQDAGMRHYTYISTLLHVMRVLENSRKNFIVLDRPNLLGAVMEGPIVEKAYESFISVAPIPIRHGLTVGELALYFNTYLLKSATQLIVVPMRDYLRTAQMPKSFSFYLSPNIKSRESCYGYSFLGVLGEVRPFNVAVGTPEAFQCILLPSQMHFSQKKWDELRIILKKFKINSEAYSYTQAKTNKGYTGLKLSIEDINMVHAWALFIVIIKFFKSAGVEITFSDMFDKAVGTHTIQDLLNNVLSYDQVKNKINSDLLAFYIHAQPIFLYKPTPAMVLLQ